MRLSLRTLTVTVGTACAVGGIALAGSQSATAAPGTLCNVNRNTNVYTGAGNSVVAYTIPAGGGFRILGLSADYNYDYGHGNGLTDGYAANDDRYYNCHLD
jgi:hypothetical protein